MATPILYQSIGARATVTKLKDAVNVLQFTGLTPAIESSAKNAIAYAMIYTRNQIPGKMHHSSAMTYILSVSDLIFPGTVSALSNAEAANFNFKIIALDSDALDAEFGYENGLARKEDPSFTIPEIGVTLTREGWEVRPELLAARWGVEMYPIGKNVSVENLSAFRVNRINAIKRMYGEEQNTPAILGNEMLPTYDTLKGVELAFNMYKMLRYSLATHWINWIRNGSDSLAQDAFLITFRLTEGFGLGAPVFISRTLYDIRSLENFDGLRSNIAEFKAAVQEFGSEPEGVRGFIKVRYGSAHRLFATVTRGALLAVAIAHRKKVEPTAANFVSTEEHSGVIAAVDAFLIGRGEQPISPVRRTGQTAAVPEA